MAKKSLFKVILIGLILSGLVSQSAIAAVGSSTNYILEVADSTNLGSTGTSTSYGLTGVLDESSDARSSGYNLCEGYMEETLGACAPVSVTTTTTTTASSGGGSAGGRPDVIPPVESPEDTAAEEEIYVDPNIIIFPEEDFGKPIPQKSIPEKEIPKDVPLQETVSEVIQAEKSTVQSADEVPQNPSEALKDLSKDTNNLFTKGRPSAKIEDEPECEGVGCGYLFLRPIVEIPALAAKIPIGMLILLIILLVIGLVFIPYSVFFRIDKKNGKKFKTKFRTWGKKIKKKFKTLKRTIKSRHKQ